MAQVYRNRQLMYLSAILFFYFGSVGSLVPFLTAHMRSLGFSLTEVSFICAVSAFFSLLGPLASGAFAERHNKYKSATVFCVFLGALASAALTFVPRYDKLVYRPLVDFDCEAGLRVERCVDWDSCADALAASGGAMTGVRLSECHYQCPASGHFAPDHPLHVCFRGGAGNLCVVYDAGAAAANDSSSLAEFEAPLAEWRYREMDADANLTREYAREIGEEGANARAQVAMCGFRASGPIRFAGKSYDRITCSPAREGCTVHCRVAFYNAKGALSLPRPCEEALGDPSTTFWTYIVLRSVADACLLSAVCLLDAMTIWSTLDYEGAYGRIHVWAALGMAAMAPLSGTLLDHFADFSPPAYLSAGLALVTCVLVAALPLHRQKSADFRQTLLQPGKETRLVSAELVVFLFVVLVLGAQWSVLHTYLDWLTSEIRCSALTVGLGVTATFGFSVPFLLISKNMIRNIGKANLLVFAMLFYFTRFAGVTFVASPWWTLPFELMGSFTLCVMWIATVAYGQSLAPSGCSLTMQYFLNMLHFGLGRGIGSVLGAYLIGQFTQRFAFCGIAVFSAVLAFLYLMLYHLCLRNRKKASSVPVMLNGTWYPLRDRYPNTNGDAKANQPIVKDQDDDIESSPAQSPNGK